MFILSFALGYFIGYNVADYIIPKINECYNEETPNQQNRKIFSIVLEINKKKIENENNNINLNHIST